MKLAFVLTAALATVAPLLAEQTAPTAAELGQAQVQRYAAALGLSSTVQEEALTLFTTEETTETAVRTAEQTADASLLTAVEANDTSAIATLSATLGGLRGQEIQATAIADGALYALLSSEQQAKFALFLEHGVLTGGPGGAGGFSGPPQR